MSVVPLSATLTPGLGGKSIAFTVNGVSVGSALSNSSGMATLNYTASNNAGAYTIGASFAGDSSVSPASGTGTLTVTKVPLTVTADNKTRVYGASNPALTATITGYVNGENAATANVTGTPTLSLTATATSSVVGSPYAITCGVGTLAAPNYSFTVANGSLTITTAALTVAADNKSRVYGAANPALTATITGYVNGEKAGTAGVTGTPTLSATATATSSVVGSPYAITCGVGTLAAPNYSFTAANGSLTITAATLTVAADNKTRVFGTANPAFTATYIGFVNGDSAASLTGTLALTTSAVTSSPIGAYSIVPAGQSSGNYAITYNNGTLSVTQAPATVTLSGLSTIYDGTVKSAVMTTTPAGLSTSVTYNGLSAAPVNAGVYLVVATITDPNYSGSSTNVMSIAKGTPAITWNAPAPIVSGTALSSTQLNATANFPGVFSYSPAAGTTLGAGANQTLLALFTPTDAVNYNSASATASITVTAAPPGGGIPGGGGTPGGGTPGPAPAITSGPTANPNPAIAGQPVQLFCAATGSSQLAWTWDFGDGAMSSTGNNQVHVFSPASAYTITATATDLLQRSATQVLVLTVLPVQFALGSDQGGSGGGAVIPPPNPLIDSDGDGFPDVIEVVAGTNPNDPHDTPFGGKPAGAPFPLPDAIMQIKLNFAKRGNDSIRLNATVMLSESFQSKDQKIVAYIGGVGKVFTLNAKGKAKAKTWGITVKSKGKRDRTGQLSITLTKGDYAQALSSAGLVNATVNKTLMVPVIILLDGKMFIEPIKQTYKAKAGKLGVTRNPK